MVQKFWRIRLGAAKKGYDRFEKVFNLCKNEKPPCIAVGWGELDLSKGIDEIEQDWNEDDDDLFGGIDEVQIRRWVEMKKGDHVIAMIRPATICAIGEIVRERYHKTDKNFKIEIEGYEEGGEVCFFNRIDIKWITNSDNYMKIKSLGLTKNLEAKLNIPLTIIELDRDNYNMLKNKFDTFESEEESSPPKYSRSYDTEGKASR